MMRDFFFGGDAKRWKRHPQTKTKNVKAKYLRKICCVLINIMMMCFKHPLSLSSSKDVVAFAAPNVQGRFLDGLLSFSSS